MGIDIGSLCTKTVLLNSEGNLLSFDIMRSGSDYRDASEVSLARALELAGVARDHVGYVVSTGYGRARAPFADGEVTEITCHARGASHLFPETRTVIDIGGQDSKVIHVDEQGHAVRFVMNDKCAAGTGRFLEVMAAALGVDITALGELALTSHSELQVSSMCTVFAESEVISMMAAGCSKADIAAAVHNAIARRITGLVGRLGQRERVLMSGGVAKNQGVVRALERKLNTTLLLPEEPQAVGALGAALIALDRMSSLLDIGTGMA
ncbi:MAG: acyl-CoA dehydratase activase [Chloroflexota bacterium]